MSGIPPRRLLCVYQHAPTPGAPGIYRHRLLLAELARRGWEVELVSCPINYMTGHLPDAYKTLYRREVIDGIQHHWLQAPRDLHASKRKRAANYAAFAIGAFMRAATLKRPSLIWASSPPLSVGEVGLALSRRFRVPWIYEVRDLWPEAAASVGWLNPQSRMYKSLKRRAHLYARKADTVIVPTPGLVDGLRSHGAKHVSVVTGVVSESVPQPNDREELRAELGLGPKTCMFLYLGALGVANGVDRLIDAASVVVRRSGFGRAFFLLVGDGSDRKRLEARLQREGLEGIRIQGAVPRNDAPRYLSAADVCLHSLILDPQFEGHLPARFMEYLSAERPIVTTAPGLTAKVALESGGGFGRTTQETVEELLGWVEMTSDERQSRGRLAKEYGLKNFGLAAVVDGLETQLNELTSCGLQR